MGIEPTDSTVVGTEPQRMRRRLSGTRAGAHRDRNKSAGAVPAAPRLAVRIQSAQPSPSAGAGLQTVGAICWRKGCNLPGVESVWVREG